jgi:2,4-dienoyl-CoA reductase-like NADH-dependent reductase (Old Yellow Enzyme family)
MKNYKLFTATKVGAIEVRNHIVMAPMTRWNCTAQTAIIALWYGW